MALDQQQAAAALQKAGVSVYGLQVEDMGGTVTLRGTVGSDADKQKAERALASSGDVQVANYLEVQPSADTSSSAGGQSYTVKPGDNLRKIAQHFYGDEMKWHAIRDANPELRANPDKIQVGMKLQIPNACRTGGNATWGAAGFRPRPSSVLQGATTPGGGGPASRGPSARGSAGSAGGAPGPAGSRKPIARCVPSQ